tara:strand:- start:317 stop:451 length:135 start_codon:yes stop_codon:yes gene_type:complete
LAEVALAAVAHLLRQEHVQEAAVVVAQSETSRFSARLKYRRPSL